MRTIDGDALMETIHKNDYLLKDEYFFVDRGMWTRRIQQAVDEMPTVPQMAKERKCIAELYSLLEQIEDRARRHDFTMFRASGISGCDMFQGLPPISRILSDVYNRYEDVINAACHELPERSEKPLEENDE